MSTKIKAKALVGKTKPELLADLEEQRKQLAALRVVQAATPQNPKVAKIQTVRKNIARILTVFNTSEKRAVRAKYEGKSRVPVDLRPKLTRAKRRELTRSQKAKTTARAAKKALRYPMRVFAVKA